MTLRICASTYTSLWRQDLDVAISALPQAGVVRCEVMAALPHIDLHAEGPNLGRRLAELSRRSGVSISGLNPPGLDLNIATADRAMRDWFIDRYVEVGRVVADAGARYLVVHPGRRHPFLPSPLTTTREWVIDALERIIGALRPSGVRILFENTPTSILDTAEDCVDVVRELGHADLGLVYDVANGHMVEDPIVAIATVAPFLEVAHLSDCRRDHWAHDPLGTGEVDVAGAMTALAAAADERDIEVVLETVHQDVELTDGITRDLAHLSGVSSVTWTLA